MARMRHLQGLRITLALGALFAPANAVQSGTLSGPSWIAYYCPKYDAVLQYSENQAVKDFGPEHPVFDPGASHPVANAATKLEPCTGAEGLICLREVQSSESPPYSIVYAVPKVIGPQLSYAVGDWEFKTFTPLSLYASKPTVLVIATLRSRTNVLASYKMYIENGVGVRYFYFDHLAAALYASSKMDHSFGDVTCTLTSPKGMFDKIRVEAKSRR